ncbi:MAG TPA: F0F1 ATP synthase subunit B' [Methylovirgula sp.]|nr:F0F1 ATP synthase subunit B' [Methylovirgula sp.]
MASTEHATGTQVATDVAAGEKPFPPFDSANFVSLLIWLALCFGGLYLLMSKFALPRVEGILHDRRAKISGDLHDASTKRAEADQAAADYQKTLAEARASAQALAQQTYARLAAETEAKRKAHEAGLAAKLAAAEAQIEATKNKAMANVEEIARETAAAIVEHITGKPANAKAIASAIAKSKA